MVNVITKIIIQKPLQVVAEYASNPDNAPSWYENIQSAIWETPKPLSIGSRVAFIAHFLGRRLAYTYEIVEYIPNQRLVMRTSEGPFPMETTYTWTAVNENSTHMTLQNKGEPSGFSKYISPFMAFMMRRANNKDLKKLKQVVEAS